MFGGRDFWSLFYSAAALHTHALAAAATPTFHSGHAHYASILHSMPYQQPFNAGFHQPPTTICGIHLSSTAWEVLPAFSFRPTHRVPRACTLPHPSTPPFGGRFARDWDALQDSTICLHFATFLPLTCSHCLPFPLLTIYAPPTMSVPVLVTAVLQPTLPTPTPHLRALPGGRSRGT